MDYISKVPRSILENILCLLPIQEAARTSVLSKEWRYIWTNIPKLVFDENTFHVSDDGLDLSLLEQDQESQRERMDSCKLLFAIFRVLFTHNCRIHEFTLSKKGFNGWIQINDDDTESDDEDIGNDIRIDVILHHLSRENTLKKLTLRCSPRYKMPSSFFTLDQLTDLYLSGCDIDIMPTFSGFGRLTSLFLENLKITDKNHINLLSMSPLLKTVTINIDLGDIDYTGYATVSKLFKCLPGIEILSLWYDLFQCYADYDEFPQKLQTALVHLKYFCVERMCFTEDGGFHILVPVIASSPNLEKLKVEIRLNSSPDEPYWRTLEAYSDILFEHLRELDIINVSNRKDAELEFVKLILAKSPVLEKVRILLYIGAAKALKSRILKILSDSPKASPKVEITVDRY